MGVQCDMSAELDPNEATAAGHQERSVALLIPKPCKVLLEPTQVKPSHPHTVFSPVLILSLPEGPPHPLRTATSSLEGRVERGVLADDGISQ